MNGSHSEIGRVSSDFQRLYGSPPSTLARSPGRVNLIGDHTDYNEGWVLPLAIDRYLYLAAGPRPDRVVVARSSAFEEPVELDLDSPAKSGPRWGQYLQGVLWAFDYRGPGLDIFIDGDLPDGAGLSSSAALELAMARTISDLSWDPTEAALLSQRAEAEWVGNECGIMDQLVIARAEPGEVLLIDCRTLEAHGYRLPDEARVVVLDTQTPRSLATTAYNDRRRACERAARAYEVEALRDLTEDRVTSPPSGLSDDDWRRARHVVAENGRVGAAAQALEDGDLAEVGRLMVESHASLRDLYEVSTPELDLMAELATSMEGCHGARMTGAGFGGSVVALIDGERAEAAIREVGSLYQEATGIGPTGHVCLAVGGTELIRVEATPT
jgi:galactokinase